jgi:hypothetical protein
LNERCGVWGAWEGAWRRRVSPHFASTLSFFLFFPHFCSFLTVIHTRYDHNSLLTHPRILSSHGDSVGVSLFGCSVQDKARGNVAVLMVRGEKERERGGGGIQDCHRVGMMKLLPKQTPTVTPPSVRACIYLRLIPPPPLTPPPPSFHQDLAQLRLSRISSLRKYLVKDTDDPDANVKAFRRRYGEGVAGGGEELGSALLAGLKEARFTLADVKGKVIKR